MFSYLRCFDFASRASLSLPLFPPRFSLVSSRSVVPHFLLRVERPFCASVPWTRVNKTDSLMSNRHAI